MQNIANFKPYPHRDIYGLDSMFLSPPKPLETWDLSSFRSAELLSFSLLALRSMLLEPPFSQGLQIVGASLELRKSFIKKKWKRNGLPTIWNKLFPLEVQDHGNENYDTIKNFVWEDNGEEVGFGFHSEDKHEKMFQSLIQRGCNRFYYRTPYHSFYYFLNPKGKMFVQEKENYFSREFYYYWVV